jgi:hypothetical protein
VNPHKSWHRCALGSGQMSGATTYRRHRSGRLTRCKTACDFRYVITPVPRLWLLQIDTLEAWSGKRRSLVGFGMASLRRRLVSAHVPVEVGSASHCGTRGLLAHHELAFFDLQLTYLSPHRMPTNLHRPSHLLACYKTRTMACANGSPCKATITLA